MISYLSKLLCQAIKNILDHLITLSPYNRTLLCKFRTVNHILPIEVGRYIYQISEKRFYLCIAKIDLTRLTYTNLKVLCPVT